MITVTLTSSYDTGPTVPTQYAVGWATNVSTTGTASYCIYTHVPNQSPTGDSQSVGANLAPAGALEELTEPLTASVSKWVTPTSLVQASLPNRIPLSHLYLHFSVWGRAPPAPFAVCLFLLGCRLMAGPEILALSIVVRIHASQLCSVGRWRSGRSQRS